jgi:hypothetical protein
MTNRAPTRAAALDAAACLHKLARARAVFVACTTRAMPTVLPVHLRLDQGTLLLGPVALDLADQLDGQVVAVGAGRPAGLLRSGWHVVVRGALTPAEGRPGTLVLDPQELEGSVLQSGAMG